MIPTLLPAEVARSLALWQTHTELALSKLREASPGIVDSKDLRTAVFVETRRSPFSEFALRNMVHFLGPGWGLELYVAGSMTDWAGNLVAEWGDIPVHVISRPEELSDASHLNRLMRTEKFWAGFKGEHLLLFDSGSMLLRPLPDKYLEFDYIGAPWDESYISPWCQVGSGKFSLRKKSAMLDVIEHCNTNHWLCELEDVFYSIAMHLSPQRYLLPSPFEAAGFAVEQIYHSEPVALHQAWKYQPAEQLALLLNGARYD